VSDMSEALQQLATTVKAAAGETVTYRRGVLFVEITAVPGRKRQSVVTDESAIMTADQLDFLVEPADLVLDGEQTLPRRGDQIVRTVGTKTYTYAVRVDGSLDAHDTDPLTTALRIRTKLVGIA